MKARFNMKVNIKEIFKYFNLTRHIFLTRRQVARQIREVITLSITSKSAEPEPNR